METNIQRSTENKGNSKPKKGLGRGLGALMPNVDISNYSSQPLAEKLIDIKVIDIKVNPFQPRKHFDEKRLEDLKNSIQKKGLITPIAVRRISAGYELIAGERRLRAFQQLGLELIPAYIMDVDNDIEMFEKAIIENVQREDLNPIDEANAYNRLIEECKLTQEQVAEVIGKDRTTIANMLRLLKLPITIQDYLRDKVLTTGHARALLALETYEEMISAAQSVINKQLSVRETEKLVKNFYEKNSTNQKQAPKLSSETLVLLDNAKDKLMHLIGTQVRILPKTEQDGKIEIEYYSVEDFQRIVELFDKEFSN